MNAEFPVEFPRPLKQAMALQSLALLYRRQHGQHKLRLMELHPCGGMYDCLALAAQIPGEILCCFNLAGTSLRLTPVGRPVPPRDADAQWHEDLWRYPGAYLKAGGGEGLAVCMEGRLGLTAPEAMPGPTPASISLSVMAQMAQRFALSSRAPFFRSGWFDSAGMTGSSVCDWVQDFPDLQARCDAAGDDWTAAARAAGRLWGIGSERYFARPDVVVDLGSGSVFRVGKEQVKKAGSLWQRYQKGEGVRALAWWLETLWKG